MYILSALVFIRALLQSQSNQPSKLKWPYQSILMEHFLKTDRQGPSTICLESVSYWEVFRGHQTVLSPRTLFWNPRHSDLLWTQKFLRSSRVSIPRRCPLLLLNGGEWQICISSDLGGVLFGWEWDANAEKAHQKSTEHILNCRELNVNPADQQYTSSPSKDLMVC